ncbi:ABC transporter ATP-binding protein [Actinopolymorpha singaporensis]|uniref:Peptide/nickel transport system ATP-binding protein n=1 Tax=Actinopolymorpha singaporensis TaxID=117157 RepID=A0A1H1TZ95_9ACTN|nr:ABC transporter ATP-binding protein [Actinopolymorpha singaporensis]SDS65615.1 peptide/nickel transport system ATP-binding protein [Actinopolymorpha singaporensis]
MNDSDQHTPVLSVNDLTVSFGSGPGAIRAVEDVSLQVRSGDIYAIVGESGCGKSTLAYSMLGVIPPPGRITAGRVDVRGRDLASMSRSQLNHLRAAEVSIVFQAAMNSFNPVTTVGRQVEDLLEAHEGVFESVAAGRAHFEELLGMVRLPTQRIWRAYEHQLSGGMKQRVAIAIALLLHPSLLVLDEPTTALDVLNQRLVLDVLRNLHAELDLSIVFVTHDLAVVAELADRVAVMYAGRLVETGTVDEIFTDARRHPYVRALISAIPSVLARGLDVRPIAGQVPNLAELPRGCRFAPRCPLAMPICREAEPPLVADRSGHAVACHVVNENLLEGTTR